MSNKIISPPPSKSDWLSHLLLLNIESEVSDKLFVKQNTKIKHDKRN